MNPSQKRFMRIMRGLQIAKVVIVTAALAYIVYWAYTR